MPNTQRRYSPLSAEEREALKQDELQIRDRALSNFRGDMSNLSQGQKRKLLKEQADLLLGIGMMSRPDKALRHRRLKKTVQRLEAKVEALEERKRTAAQIQKSEFVYVVGAVGQPVKIGIAAEPERRLKEIQTGFPHRLRIYLALEVGEAARAVERECHRRLASCRLNGEWFDIEPDDAIEAVKAVSSQTESVR